MTFRGLNVSTNLEPKVKDSELASYSGWDQLDLEDPQDLDATKPSGPVPLLDEEDHVTPETIQHDRPWWMRPTPRMVVAGCGVMALVYAMFSMFGLWGSSEPKSASTLTPPDAAALDQEAQEQLNRIQRENEDLKRERVMGSPLPPENSQNTQAQSAQPVSTSPRTVATVPRRSTYVAQSPRRIYTTPTARPSKVSRPAMSAGGSTPRLVTRPITSSATKPKTARFTKSSTASPKAPALDPYEQWVAAANRGHYVAATGTTPVNPNAQAAVYTSSSQPTPDSPTLVDSTTATAAPTVDIPTYETVPEQQSVNNLPPQSVSSDPTQSPEIQPPPSDPTQLLDIGSTAKAVLESSIAWTPEGPEQKSSYILRLKEGFKNRSGVEVLPKDTDLIAQMTQTSDAGLFFMDVTHILRGPKREKVALPQGGIQVVAEDGSPLKAEQKQKGGPNFLANAAKMIAPGLERAMGAIASSADSLVMEDGDRSLIRTSGGDDNPLAAGVGGVAEGVSEMVSNRQNNTQRQPSTPYFKFDGGTTVRVVVNQDVQL